MLLLVSAWILSVLGVALAYVIDFANGMKTAPSKSTKDRLISAALPLVALVLVALVLGRAWQAQAFARGLLLAGVPLLLALFGLVVAFAPMSRNRGYKSEYETATRRDGTKYFRDSRKNWSLDEAAYRSTVAREAAGDRPPQNAASWAEYWTGYMEGLWKWHGNPPRRIDFIVQLRREAKLPELAVPAAPPPKV